MHKCDQKSTRRESSANPKGSCLFFLKSDWDLFRKKRKIRFLLGYHANWFCTLKKIPFCILQVEINSSIQPIKEIDAQVSFVVSVDMLHFPTRFHETPSCWFLCNPADRLKTCLHPGFYALEELPVTWAELSFPTWWWQRWCVLLELEFIF